MPKLKKTDLRAGLEIHASALFAASATISNDEVVIADIKENYKGGIEAAEALLSLIQETEVRADSMSDDDLQRAVLEFIAKLPDEAWKRLGEATQEWSNAIFDAEKATKLEKNSKKAEKKAKADKQAEKEKVDAAKTEAKEEVAKQPKKSVALHYRIPVAGNWSRVVYDLVAKAGKEGITVDDLIKAASSLKNKPTKTNADSVVKRRVYSLSKNLEYGGCGTIYEKDGKYFARSYKECLAEREKEAKEAGIDAADATYELDDGGKKPAAKNGKKPAAKNGKKPKKKADAKNGSDDGDGK